VVELQHSEAVAVVETTHPQPELAVVLEVEVLVGGLAEQELLVKEMMVEPASLEEIMHLVAEEVLVDLDRPQQTATSAEATVAQEFSPT
jgi:hypothetical protein